VDLRHKDDEGGRGSWIGQTKGGTWIACTSGRSVGGWSCLRWWHCGGRKWCWGSHRRGSGKGSTMMVSSKSSSSGRLELLLGSSMGAGVGLTGLMKGNGSRC
jgi:hypothetical protein